MLNISQLMREQGEGELPGGNPHSSGVIWSLVFLLLPPSGASVYIARQSCQPKQKKISRRSRKEIQFPADIQELECLVCGRHRYIKGRIAHCMPSFRRGASHGTQRPVVGCYSLSGWPGESQHSAGSRSPRPCFHCQIPIPLFPEVSWEGDAVRDQLARDTYMQAVTLRVPKQRLFSLLPICDLTGRPFFFFFLLCF